MILEELAQVKLPVLRTRSAYLISRFGALAAGLTVLAVAGLLVGQGVLWIGAFVVGFIVGG